MLAIFYLILCTLFGVSLVNLLVPDIRRLYVACSPNKNLIKKIPSTLFTVPAGTLIGMTSVSFVHYYVTLGLSYAIDNGTLCKRIAILIVFAFFLWLFMSNIVLINKHRMDKEKTPSASLPEFDYTFKNTLFYGIIAAIVTAFSCFLFFYSYKVYGNTLYAGFSVFSDLSPHTAMTASFANGFNFPTQYMHFSGDGIQYHFFFYFLCGMLNYMGLPIDYALNIPSIIVMVCALMLLGLLAMLMSGRRWAFAIAPFLVFFRSSLNVFHHINELSKIPGMTPKLILSAILHTENWYKVTDYDNWGIWAINVYPNQRHLMLGVGFIIMMVILFIPFVRRMCIAVINSGSFGGGIKAFLFSRNAWLPRKGDPLSPFYVALFASIGVLIFPYFHGSALIALLLILLGMAIFSESRLLYLMVAAVAVGSSYIQTAAFSGGPSGVVSFKWNPGFILETFTVKNFLTYTFNVTGFTLIFAIICALVWLIHDIAKKKPIYRSLLLIAFMFPFAFAFMFQVTLEMLANHKFIQVSLILVDAIVACFLSYLFAIPFKMKKPGEGEELTPIEEDKIMFEGGNAEESESSESSESEDSSESTESSDLENISSEEEEIEEEPELLFGTEGEGSNEIISSSKGIPALNFSFGDDDAPTISESSNTDSDEDDDLPVEVNTDDVEDDTFVFSIPAPDIDMKDVEVDSSDSSESEEEDEIPTEEVVGMRPGSMEVIAADMERLMLSKESESDESEEIPEETALIQEIPTEEVAEVVFGDEEPKPEISETETESESDEEPAEEKPEVLEHKPIAKPKKGLSPVAFIAVQLIAAILGVFLLAPLMATGFSEWCVFTNINKNSIQVNLDSPMVKWIEQNTDESDVFLTPNWSMNRFYLAGRAAYYGWPYYAWSAGHDTDTRDVIYAWLISGCGENIDEFRRYCQERHIKYLIADPEFDDSSYAYGLQFNWEFFAENLQEVASFTSDNNTIIYQIY